MDTLLLRWNQRRWRRRQEIVAEAHREQEAERRAALARLRNYATTQLPTVPRAPLLTPGQAARSRGQGR